MSVWGQNASLRRVAQTVEFHKVYNLHLN